MDSTAWILPILIVVALGTTVSYFFGRRQNAALMNLYSHACEQTLKPLDQKYTWIGGYIGFKAEYKVKDEVVKQVKATLQLKPRMSLLYLPIARFTMRHDKLFFVFECKQSLPGEAHLIKKGQYRFVPAGIDRVEQFKKRDVTVGGEEFEILSLDSRGEKELLHWAENICGDNGSLIKHLSFTSSTNVVYAYIEPTVELIEKALQSGPGVAKSLTR